ncbi:MAG: M61 family metallopeptidase, partial [Cyanobium sp.]
MPEVRLDLREPHRHLVEVSIRFSPRAHLQRLRLPAWTPGSYLIRDYVRTLEHLRAEADGLELPLRRTGVAEWTLDPPRTGSTVTLSYRILATELSVRTCRLDGDHGFLALAGVVLLVEGERWSPHGLELLLPPGWEGFVPLPSSDAHVHRWNARDYDQLIDSPVQAGALPCHAFSVAGVAHRWVSWGGDLVAEDPHWLEDVSRVCLQCCLLLGETGPAAADYLFVLHRPQSGYGGLEHDDGSVLVYGQRELQRPEGRRRLLQLVAHEYLHQWNVRRLRPAELSPYDYDRPTIVPSLWFAEGLTSYFDQLLPVAAGLADERELLSDLGADLSRYLLTPGRAVQSLRESSQEAWVKLYRQDAHSADSQISYYLKGAVLALVLDLQLRRSGSWLGAVLQQLWRSHGRSRRGYREADLLQAFQAHDPALAGLLPDWLEGRRDPPLREALATVGLILVQQGSEQWGNGLRAELQDGALVLRRVERDGVAQKAGLQVGDELLAVAGLRLRSVEDLANALKAGEGPPPVLP